MNILFIGYWAFHEGLTQSTILPNLHILSDMEEVKRVIFVSIEREDLTLTPQPLPSKCEHVPLHSGEARSVIQNKIEDFTRFPKKLKSICAKERIDFIIARGSPAGALAYLIHKKTKIPFIVESFEPHTDYMIESGVWSPRDPRALIGRRWEKKQIRRAFGLLPVADNYKEVLINMGVANDKIFTVRCPVDLEKFKPGAPSSNQGLTGIYVGKFGGLYLEDEAFRLFQQAFQQQPDMRLILLNPAQHDYIRSKIKEYKLPEAAISIHAVPHDEVPGYLAMASFALGLYKPGPSKRFLSPIKVGEYWSAGLPVLLTKGIGDDANFIQKQDLGVLFDPTNETAWEDALDKIFTLAKSTRIQETTRKAAETYRSMDQVKAGYTYFFKRLRTG